MDSIDQPDDDFFQAFLHSLRASCYQFLDFREHVNIRGFLSVEVDGTRQRHLVLAENVARGPANITASFPLQNLTQELDATTIASQCPQPACTRNTARQIGVCPPLQSKRHDISHIPSAFKTRRSFKSVVQSPRRCFMQGTRRDSSNTTFTVESIAQQKKPISDTNIGLTSPARHVSATTIDVSPSKSHLHHRDIVAFSTNVIQSQSDISNSSDEELRHPSTKLSRVPSSRKRPHKSSTESSNTGSPFRPTISISIDDISPVTLPDARKMADLIYNKELRRKRDKQGKKSKQQVNRERAKANREMVTQRRTLIQPFPCLMESDQECKITSVRPPYYLVNHADDHEHTQ